MDAQERLRVLADDSRYDLACACGGKDSTDHRKRGENGLWLYPASVPRGGKSVLLKTLATNACSGDCAYCPLRRDRDIRRCAMSPEEIAAAFLAYYERGEVFGLFLSSGIVRSPDHTMDRLIATARVLRRRHGFRGYVHLKVVPGASDAALREALGVASAVSLNVEAPTGEAFRKLSKKKDYERDVVRPMRLLGEWTARGTPHARVGVSTQFVVGASDETDRDLVRATEGLYRRVGLNRVYFSAYQRGLGDASLPGEHAESRPDDLLTREHRLYQVDWLLRQYGFDANEIPLDENGNLSLADDPKESWAKLHPECFPVDVNRARRRELLRVPGFGPVTVRRIMARRKEGGRLRSLRDVGRVGKVLARARPYVTFGQAG
jgi:predicted DNA-binding helix-hairpin-helix protein